MVYYRSVGILAMNRGFHRKLFGCTIHEERRLVAALVDLGLANVEKRGGLDLPQTYVAAEQCPLRLDVSDHRNCEILRKTSRELVS